MSSSVFINETRSFTAIRGNVIELRSDRGTNFIGATDDLGICAINVENMSVQKVLQEKQFSWIFNPPHASHMQRLEEHEHHNIFSRLATMGNQTISSYGGDKISEITEYIKIMHDSMESMKQEIVSLKNKRKTENGETSSKRIKLMEAESGTSCSEDSDSDDAIASFLADQMHRGASTTANGLR
jgi:hypothetical protein